MTTRAVPRGRGSRDTIGQLLEKQPGQPVVVTAIGHLYSETDIRQFLTDYTGLLRADEKARFGQAGHPTSERYLRKTELVVNHAFTYGGEQITEGTRQKWKRLLEERRPRPQAAPQALLRGVPASLFAN